MIDLSPDRDPADLIDALYAARRENRQDLAGAVVTLLRHHDPVVREEAVALLLAKWGIGDLRETARQMLQSDEDDGVRARVALGVASIATPQTRSKDAALIAEVYRHSSASRVLQLACLEALSLIAGHPTIAEYDDLGPKAVKRLLDRIDAMRV